MERQPRGNSFLRTIRPAFPRIALALAGACCALLAQSFADGQERGVPSKRAPAREASLLELGKPVRREITFEERHRYGIPLRAGDFLRVLVEQSEVDVAIKLLGPAGGKVLEADNPNGPWGPERLSHIAQVSGAHSLEVRATRAGTAGTYEVRIEALRPSAPEDSRRIAAEKVFAEGGKLGRAETAVSLRQAIEKYEEALSISGGLASSEEESETLSAIAKAHSIMGETDKAIAQFERALAGARAAGCRRCEAFSLAGIGQASNSRGERAKALEYAQKALVLWRATGYRVGVASALHDIGYVQTLLGERQEALNTYREALPLWRAMGERQGEANTLLGIGVAEDVLGNWQRSLDAYEEALRLLRADGERRGVGVALHNIGLVYSKLGEPSKALRYLLQALPLRREVGDPRMEAASLTAIAKAHAGLGEKKEALDSYNRALSLTRSVKDPRGQAVALTGLGAILESSGENAKALEYQTEALRLRQELKDSAGAAWVRIDLGSLYSALGDRAKALGEYRQALPVARATANPQLEADALYHIALAEREGGNLAEARLRITEAVQIIESLRSRVRSPDLRATYLASVRKVYELFVDLLMELHGKSPKEGLDALALAGAERARARSLLELLHEGTQIRQGVAPELLERERSVRQLLSSQAERRMRLLNAKHTEEQAVAAEREHEGVKTELEEIEGQIRASSPRYAALTQPRPLTLPEVQRELDADSLLIEYSLGEQRSFLWAVTAESLSSYELPRRSEVEAAARRFHELLIARNRSSKPERPEARRARIAKADAEYGEAAALLSRMLLAPVSQELGKKRLLIVGDGALQYVPFAALPSPPGTGEGSPLFVDHEIVSLPSAAVLAVLRRDTSGRAPAPGLLAVLADPVFDREDERVSGRRPSGRRGQSASAKVEVKDSREETEQLLRSATEAGLTEGEESRVPRLLSTRREAQAILKLVPSHARMEALDFQASRATATSAKLSGYRFVHFATHGFLNSQHPELSGIVLSLVDREGREQSGFLTAPEIYNLNLPAELVVLSGCRTALGKEIKGEGLVGLTRGFLYAGAARVVASLWKVDDLATAVLMERFYQGMLGEKKLRPAAALRAAQISMWNEKRWSAPYYWAAFVLQGEWR